MKKMFVGVGMAVLLLAQAPSVGAAGAVDPMTLVPKSAAIVLRINNLDKALAGFEKMVGQVDENAAKMAGQMVRAKLGEFLGNADLTGVNTAGTHMAILFITPEMAQGMNPMAAMGGPGGPPAKNEPPYALIVQVKDYAAFRTAMAGDKKIRQADGFDVLFKEGREIDFEAMQKAQDANPGAKVKIIYKTTRQESYLLKRGTFAVFAPNKKSFDLIKTVEKNLTASLSADDKKMLTESDVALFVNLDTIVTMLRPMIEQLKMMLNMAAGGGMGMPPGAADNPAMKQQMAAMQMGMKMLNGFIQFVYDLKGATVGLKFAADAVTASTLVDLKPGSNTAKAMANHPPSTIRSLGFLPAGKMVYMGADFKMKGFIEWYANVAQLMLTSISMGPMGPGPGGPGGAKEAKMVEKALGMMKKIAEADIREFGVMYNLGDGKSGMEMVMYVRAEKPELIRASYGPELQDMFKGMMPPGIDLKYKRNAETYKGLDIDLLEVKLDIAALQAGAGGPGDGAEEAKAMMKAMFGGETIVVRYAVKGKWLITALGEDPKQMHAAIDAMLAGTGPLAGDADFQNLRKRLPAKNNFLLVVDAPRTVKQFITLMKLTPAGRFMPDVDKDVVVDGPPAGLAITVNPAWIRIDTVVPYKQIAGVKKLVGGAKPKRSDNWQ